MNTPEITFLTIGSEWREKDDKSAVVIVIHISPSAVLVTGEQFADGWTWYSKVQFADTFEPHVREEWIALREHDFSTRMCWLRKGTGARTLVVSICETGVYTVDGFIGFDVLMYENWERCEVGTTEWQPCKKLKA